MIVTTWGVGRTIPRLLRQWWKCEGQVCMLRVLMHPQLKTAKYRLNMNMSLPCLACPLLNQKNCFVPCVEVLTLPRDIVGACGYVWVLSVFCWRMWECHMCCWCRSICSLLFLLLYNSSFYSLRYLSCLRLRWDSSHVLGSGQLTRLRLFGTTLGS